MREPTGAQPSPGRVDLARLRVGGQHYAIDVAAIREIVRSATLTPLPDAPALIEGVLDLRGAVIPVVDLARVLGFGRSDEGPEARIVVLAIAGLALGLRVEAATDVLGVDATAIEPLPGLATAGEPGPVRRVVRRPDGRPLLVIDPEVLVRTVERSGGSSSRPAGSEVAA